MKKNFFKKTTTILIILIIIIFAGGTFLYLKTYKVNFNKNYDSKPFLKERIKYLNFDNYKGLIIVDIDRNEIIFLKPILNFMLVDQKIYLSKYIEGYTILDVADKKEEFCVSSYKEKSGKFFNKISCFTKLNFLQDKTKKREDNF